MKTIKQALLLTALFALIKCESPSNEIKTEFEKVNQSLTSSNSLSDSSVEQLFLSIDTIKTLTPDQKAKADSMHYSMTSVYECIESLQQLMQTKDSTGTDLSLAENILVRSDAGNVLTQKLQDVQRCSYWALADSAKKPALDDIWSTVAETSHRSWKAKYFHGIPTVAAITILNKLKNDCTNAATLVLLSIRERPKS